MHESEHPRQVWSFDIDGVLNNYPDVWLTYIEREAGQRFRSVDEARQSLGGRYEHLKHAYRLSTYKYHVPLNPEAIPVIALLRHRGDLVYIATSRPYEKYPHMRAQSLEWLQRGGIVCDGFLEKRSDVLRDVHCSLHIDDEEESIRVLRAQGIRCAWYVRADAARRTCEFPDVEAIRSLALLPQLRFA